ncbi:hypothetical protein [Streptomyces lavendofoliae]|uniref:Uncharacterized protein n=1 Tax=Streptomyces lavendofoliae TaxID=67314 RepID=A0A918I2M5_9ACTN|nr:hypothetical protein [Streptomyces lavendofoliae]GGU52615.1 hypothetical protein GCM10010274_46940 [Streptomyces lavendofoliae]
MARARIEFDRRVFRQIASSPEMAAYLLRLAQQGEAIARALAPVYSGPTWGNAVRAENYRKSLDAKLVRNSFGWRSEIGANVAYAVQVEFGSGRPNTSRERPQEGHSPKWRVLGRTLDAMRSI